MDDYSKYLIRADEPVINAMKKINLIPGELTLLVEDSHGHIMGSLTDGDIRRKLIDGLKVTDPVCLFAYKDFSGFSTGSVDVKKLRELKAKGVKVVPVLQNKKLDKILFLNKIDSVLPLTGFIMAGGFGKRLRPLTDSIPKPMLELGGKPLIEQNILRMARYGIEEIYVSVNYMKEKIIDYLKDGSGLGVKIQYIHEDKPLGTIGSLSLINKTSFNNILLMNADLITNVDFENLYLDHINENASLTMASIPYSVDIPYAIMECEGNKVEAIKEKPKNTYYANAGIYLMNKEVINQIPQNTFYNATDLIEKLINEKQKVIHSPITGYWIDIGNPDDFNKAREFYNHLQHK